MQLGGGGDSLAHVGVCTPTPSPLKLSSGPKAGAQELLPCSLESPGSSQSSLRRSVRGFQVLNIAQKALGLAWVTQQLVGDASNKLNQEGKTRPLPRSPWGARQHLNRATLVLSSPSSRLSLNQTSVFAMASTPFLPPLPSPISPRTGGHRTSGSRAPHIEHPVSRRRCPPSGTIRLPLHRKQTPPGRPTPLPPNAPRLFPHRPRASQPPAGAAQPRLLAVLSPSPVSCDPPTTT